MISDIEFLLTEQVFRVLSEHSDLNILKLNYIFHHWIENTLEYGSAWLTHWKHGFLPRYNWATGMLLTPFFPTLLYNHLRSRFFESSGLFFETRGRLSPMSFFTRTLMMFFNDPYWSDGRLLYIFWVTLVLVNVVLWDGSLLLKYVIL